jgi:BirA family transcriptional regulator, biotin operon repressor / biotin---[acetyl-CoA-carboxylase] ligase
MRLGLAPPPDGAAAHATAQRLWDARGRHDPSRLVKPGADLAAQPLAELLGDRPFESHPVLLSTAVSAADWARSGAPHGAVVVADYQIAPRGRAGQPWKVTPGHGLGFGLVLRPQVDSTREGWLYVAVLAGLADACGEGVTIHWPDEVRRDGVRLTAVGLEVKLGGLTVKWAVANVLIADAQPPRGELLRSVLEAIDARLASPPRAVLDDYDALCRTVGRDVRIRLLGSSGRIEGRAARVLDDGALVVEIDGGRQVPVRPQDVGSIEDL